MTAATTDKDISSGSPSSLTNAVIQVEKILKRKIQDVSPLAPKELALEARDFLIQMAEEPKDADLTRKPVFLIPNPVYEIDPSTQQNPGVPVTPEGEI